jgi:hypothetical protein
LDIYIVNLDGEGVFLRNNHGNSNNWLLIALEGTESNRDAVGALVSISAGGKKQVSLRRTTTGYLSQNDHRIHFGLGDNSEIDSIEIRWPSGKVQVLQNVEANQILSIKEE